MASTYTVTGMTCGHCAASVREEIEEISGVTAVEVDHTSGAVVVTGDGFTDEQIAAAVTEAGYTLQS